MRKRHPYMRKEFWEKNKYWENDLHGSHDLYKKIHDSIMSGFVVKEDNIKKNIIK